MKKRNFGLIIFLFALCLISFNFVSAAAFNATIVNSTGEAGIYQIFNVTVNNIDALKNITQVNITNVTGPISMANPINTSTNATITATGLSLVFNNSVSLIRNGSAGYFWFNATTNILGNFAINVSTLDNNSTINWTWVNITVNDTTKPFISYVTPTPANNTIISSTSLPINISAIDLGTGISNITIYVYNSTGSLIQNNSANFTAGNYSTFFFVNYTGVNGSIYYINATAFDNANNSNSTGTFNFMISVPGSGGSNNNPPTCTPNWNNYTWSYCYNGIQTQIWVDANKCNTTTGMPVAQNQTCTSCTTNWVCGNWTPTVCSSSNGTQIRTCTDSNGCSADRNETRNCISGSSTNSSSQKTGASAFSFSSAFYIVVIVIVASVIGVVIILVRLRKKSPSSDFGRASNQPRFAPRGPPAGPFSNPKYEL